MKNLICAVMFFVSLLQLSAATVEVDLSYSGKAETVNVPMDLNGWDKNANPMVKDQDGVFRIRLQLSPGEYQYKFLIDQKEWILDPANEKKVNDGKFDNSLLTAGTSEQIQQAKLEAEKELTEVTLKFKSDASAVTVPMNINNWNKKANPMVKGTDGVFSVTLKLKPGKYLYKFCLDGKEMVTDPDAPKEKSGKYEDSVLIVNKK